MQHHAEQDLFAAWSDPPEIVANVRRTLFECLTGETPPQPEGLREDFNELFDPIRELFDQLVEEEDRAEAEEAARAAATQQAADEPRVRVAVDAEAAASTDA